MAQYDLIKADLEKVWSEIDEILKQIPGVEEMISIKGVAETTVAGFFAEIGDLQKYESPEQIIKLAGLNLKLATSGKWKGKTIITKRGRPKLRALLFKVVLPQSLKTQHLKHYIRILQLEMKTH